MALVAVLVSTRSLMALTLWVAQVARMIIVALVAVSVNVGIVTPCSICDTSNYYSFRILSVYGVFKIFKPLKF